MTDNQSSDLCAGVPSGQATRPDVAAPSWRPFTTPIHVETTGSTNADVIALAASGAAEGTVVTTNRQLEGRGRLGRRWLDHEGGSVLCSILFRPSFGAERWFLVQWLVALAAIEAIGEVTGVKCSCKWPNDLLSIPGEKKVAGMLAEVAPAGALVVGIGINCNWPGDFPPPGEKEAIEIAARATSLNRLAGTAVDRDAISAAMLEDIAHRWAELDEAELRQQYRRACSTLGRNVRVELMDAVVEGTAIDLDEAGRLLVDDPAGERHVVGAGDVVHLRGS